MHVTANFSDHTRTHKRVHNFFKDFCKTSRIYKMNEMPEKYYTFQNKYETANKVRLNNKYFKPKFARFSYE